MGRIISETKSNSKHASEETEKTAGMAFGLLSSLTLQLIKHEITTTFRASTVFVNCVQRDNHRIISAQVIALIESQLQQY